MGAVAAEGASRRMKKIMNVLVVSSKHKKLTVEKRKKNILIIESLLYQT